MAGLYEGLEQAATVPAAPPAPRAPAGLYDGLELVSAPGTPGAPPRAPSGILESAQAGLQGSALGLAWRRRLPELAINPDTNAWWERAIASFAHVGAELPLMIGGAMAGGPAGAAVAGPGGAILGAGFAMGVVPATIRQSLIEAYKAGEANTPVDWFNAVREVAKQALFEGGINAAAMGAGAAAKGALATARGASSETAKAIAYGTATPLTRAGAMASETVDLATQIATMVAVPSVIEQRMPKAQEFLDAAILIGGLKVAHITANRMMNTYQRTGKTPAEQVADAQQDPQLAAELARPEVDPTTLTTSGVPVKMDRLIAEAEFLARGGVPEAPNIRQLIKEIKAEGPYQGDMVRDIERIGSMYEKARLEPLSDPERAELGALKARVAELEARTRETAAAEPVVASFTPDQATEARRLADERLAALEAKDSALTDAERAERVFLKNARPEAVARHFGLEPQGLPRRITAEEREASAQRVHDDVLAQLRDVDQARRDAGLQPLGDDHAQAVAALVRARVRTRAARMGMLPEEIYSERPLQIRDATAAEVLAAEEAIPPGAPRFKPPEAPAPAAGEIRPQELDMFGEPVREPVQPRYAVENLVTVEVPLASLVLSKEVPQFKHAADAKGVIVPLGGQFDRTGVGPIQVWERLDGTLEVISGRHRLDLAQRSGEATIPAQIHREAEGFDARRAATLDAELNIREEQGSVADYAQYFRDSGTSKEAAEQRGLLARAKGKAGFAIARDGTDDLIAANRAGVLSDEAALAISAAAPGSERLQALGIAMVNEGKSILMAVNTMKAMDLMVAERMAKGQQGDLWGFDDSAVREATAMAKKASAEQRRISEQIAAVNGASKRPELARKMGVDVQDPDGIRKRVLQLKQDQELLDNWPLHPEIVARLRGTATKPVTGREGELKQGPVVKFDAKEGMGAVPDNQNVDYLGFATEMSAFKFLRLAANLERPNAESMRRIKEAIDEGQPIGIPFLEVSWNAEKKQWDVRSHEGRHRALAIADMAPETVIPVHIFPRHGMRARDITPEMREAPMVAQDTVSSRELSERINKLLAEIAATKLPPEFDLKPETPAELDARNRVAAEQAMRMADLDFTARPAYGVDRAPQERNLEAARAGVKPEDLPATVAGGRPREGWAGATRIRGAAGPLQIYRGGGEPLRPEYFAPEALGRASGNPSSGLGVWFTPSQAEAATYGKVERAFLDLRNPKVIRIEDLPGFETTADATAFREQLRAAGHDGIVVTAKHLNGKTHVVAFDPEHVIPHPIDEAGTMLQSAKAEPPAPPGPAERWYSALTRAVDTATMKAAPVQGWKDWLRGQQQKGVKAEEIKWSGLEEWLDLQQGRVSKEQVRDFVASNGVRVEEKMLGGKEARSLQDARIAPQLRVLHENGWTADTDPSDPNRVGFVSDPEHPIFGGEIVLADDIANEASRMPRGPERKRMEQAARAAIEVEYYMARDAAGEPQTKFSPYALPGAKEGTYRELLLTLPEKLSDADKVRRENELASEIARRDYGRASDDLTAAQSADVYRQVAERLKAEMGAMFTSSHFDEPNILAHVRFNERTDAEGKRVLFVEEFQSDWAQKGKKEGFSGGEPSRRRQELQRAVNEGRQRVEMLGIEAVTAVRPHVGEEFTRLDNPADRQLAEIVEADAMGQNWEVSFPPEVSATIREWLDAQSELHRMEIAAENAASTKSGVPAAPFVGKTEAWVGLALKRMIRYAAENGFDRVAWTTGEQQVSRYTNALRKAVDTIEWTKTPEGVQLVGYKKVRGQAEPDPLRRRAAIEAIERNDNLGFDTAVEALHAVRRAFADEGGWENRWEVPVETDRNTINAHLLDAKRAMNQDARSKVVDTTEKEDALSDAIGKAMADRILQDPNQTGVIEGENIRIDDTGMAAFYDRIVPNVAKDVLKKLGGGKISETEIAVNKSDTKPEVLPIVDTRRPDMAPMRGTDRMGLDGLEDFPNGDKPIHGEATISVNGTRAQVLVVADATGVHLLGEAAGDTFELAVYSDSSTALEARELVAHMWSPNSGQTWREIQVNNGLFPPKASERSKQLSFEITPEMRAKALEGLPLFQKERGSYQIAEKLITTMQGADRSTVVHELGHDWLEEMKYDASRPDAPAQIKADWDLLRRELAIGEDGTIERASHEQFARSVERYLMEGEAPSAGLRGVFERFKAWLLDIYRSVMNLNVEINPELKAVLDRMLATDQEIADARELGVPRAYVAEAKVQEARKIVPGFKAEQVSMEPYADELPKGPGEAPDSSHINYAYINSPLDVKLTMQRMAEIDQANIQRQRGGTAGVKSWAESNAEQAKYVNDVLGGNEDTLKVLSPRDPDAPGPDVRLGILKKLAVGAAKDSARLRDVVLQKGHDATVREQLEYMGSIERARMIQAEFLGERASVARALNALKDVTEGSGEIGRMLDAIGYGEAAARADTLFQDPRPTRTPAEEQAYLKAKLDEIMLNYGGRTPLDIARLHKEIGTLKGTFRFAKEVTKATKWEMVVEGWKASLLSGPVTHTTNLFGTGAFMAVRAPVDAVAALIGMARGASPGMGETDRASMSEAVARITGMLGGVQDGLRAAKATFDLDDPTGKTEAYRNAIPGRAGDLIRIPLRLMGAEDALVSTMYKRGELKTMAIRQAFDENLNPLTREFADRVTHLTDNPTPEMEAAATAAATRMTFNMPLGEKGVALQLFVNKWNLQWMIPFIRTPINITKEVARMSAFAPLVGEWRADMAKGGVARDKAIAEFVLGSGIMALTMAYAFAGQVSGGGGPDPGKNRGKAGVEQPYSWKVGDTWYEYARIQPTGTLMGMAADIAAAWDHMTDEEKDKVPRMLARAFANAVTNQTFLQGITNVINAMSDPTRFAPKFLQQLAGSAVPNVIGQPTAMADPVVREVNSAIEAIYARLPGMRETLLPKRDWLGEEVKTKERLGVVGPVRMLEVSKDKVRLEAAKLDISMAAPPKKTHIGKGTGKLGDVELTPEEQDTFEKVGGKLAHEILTEIVNDPSYDALPPLIKKRMFSQVLQSAHKVAAVAALPMEKRAAYLQQITERVAAELALPVPP